jgi:hypothetical protein
VPVDELVLMLLINTFISPLCPHSPELNVTLSVETPCCQASSAKVLGLNGGVSMFIRLRVFSVPGITYCKLH